MAVYCSRFRSVIIAGPEPGIRKIQCHGIIQIAVGIITEGRCLGSIEDQILSVEPGQFILIRGPCHGHGTIDLYIGSIATGKYADLLFVDENLNVAEVYVDGIQA